MIIASEVRIGNLLYGTHGKVSEVNIDAIKYLLTYGGTNQCQVKPIPLTEEWLIRFGFKKDDSDEDNSWLNLRFGLLNFASDESVNFQKVYLYVNKMDVVCEYVHQLQNLYFALTQTELKFTEHKND
jgi:hypothetical protein